MTRSFTATISSCIEALTLLGCVAQGPYFVEDPIPETQGRLYVELDEPLASFRPQGYATVTLPPGKYVVSAQRDPFERQIRVVAGRALYCGFSTDQDLLTREWRIQCSDDRDAHGELNGCRRQELDPGSPFEP